MLLREQGYLLRHVADSVGRTLSFVSRVNNGRRRSRLVEREIARRLMLSAEEAFPEWARRHDPGPC